MGEIGGNNLYRFCNNDPLALFDPLGLRADIDMYATVDDAAEAALKDILSLTRSEGVEFCGWIYRNRNGTFSYTRARMGAKDASGRDLCRPGKCDAGTKVGGYHTHLEGNIRNADQFSEDDKKISDAAEIPSYLAVPETDFRMQKYNPGKEGNGKVEFLELVEPKVVGTKRRP